MRIPRLRAVPLLLAVSSVLAGCNAPYADGRLAPRVVPGISSRTPSPRGPAVESPAAEHHDLPASALSKVPAARVTETDVVAFVETLAAQHGRAGLMALEPGDTLVDRLRFCTSRIMLERTKAVLPELKRLAVDHPDNPLVWRQLSWGLYWEDERTEAVHCMSKAYAVAKLDGFETCPHLPSFLGQLLLERSATRDKGIKLLRNELAEGSDFVRSCWNLAEYFCARERHADALACIDATMARAPKSVTLVLEKAKVLLDLNKPDDVVALLEPILRQPAPNPIVIETMMRARMLRGELADAVALADLLLTRSDLNPAEKKDLQTRRDNLVEAKRVGRRVLISPWEVYAVLRGDLDIGERRRMLRNVVAQKNVRVREKALNIAFNSEVPALRAEALILLIPNSTEPVESVRAGLKDESGNVRGTAALLAAGAVEDRDKLAELVLEFLARETDAYAFRQMHKALCELTGELVELPLGAAEDSEQRVGIVARWKKTAQRRQGK